jgi:HK97 family phage major capsid protein
MTLKEKLRLALLSAKAARTAEEQTELDALTAQAKAANLDAANIAKEFAPDADASNDDAGKGVTDAELKSLIEGAVAKAIPQGSGVDTAAVIKEIREAGKGAKGITVEDIEATMKKHLGGTSIDKDALVAEIKKLMPAAGITGKELAEALDNFAKSVRQPSKMAFDNGFSNEFPCEHRSGNLTVAQKQLLNLCVMNTSDEAKAESVKQNGGRALAKSINDGITEEQLSAARASGEARLKSLRNSIVYGGKTLTATGVGTGRELVPTDLSSDLQARMYLESMLAAEMLASEINMPTQPFEFPMTTTRPNFYIGGEAPTDADLLYSDTGTGKITLDAKKLIGISEYSYEADEDSIIAVLPMIQEQLGSGAADAFEGALINGDTTATHQDSDIAAVSAHSAKMFKGFRKYALAGNLKVDLSTGGISADNIVAMRKKLKRWGIRPADLILLVGPQGYNDLVNLDETLTWEKVGNQAAARILTGEASSIFGIRIVVSSQVREDLNANGVYDGTTTTKGSMLLVHKPSWMVGSRRGFTVEVETWKKRQINSIIASFRRAFTPKETPSLALPSVVLGYNYTA